MLEQQSNRDATLAAAQARARAESQEVALFSQSPAFVRAVHLQRLRRRALSNAAGRAKRISVSSNEGKGSARRGLLGRGIVGNG